MPMHAAYDHRRPAVHQSTRVRLARRCWVEEEVAEDLPARCAAILETSADDTVIASVTAARLHELWLPPLPDKIHLATASPGRPGRAMTRTRRPEFVAHRFQLRPCDVVVVSGVPVTSLARTWRDLGRLLPLPDLVAAGDSALRSGALLSQMHEVLDASPPGLGAKRLRTAVSMVNRRSRSRPESHMRVAVCAPDLPAFEVNESIYRDEGGWLAEPDLSLKEAKLLLEYQGADHAALQRMRKDLTRFADVRREHWLPLPFGPAEVFRRPWEIRAEVRREIRSRAPHLLRSTRGSGRSSG